MKWICRAIPAWRGNVRIWLAVNCLLQLAASSTIAAGEKAGEAVPKGDIRSSHGFYSVVFYYAPTPRVDTLATAKALVTQFLPGLPLSLTSTNTIRPPFVAFEEEHFPLKNFPVPDAGYFRYAGRGLSSNDITQFQKTRLATRLVLEAPRDDVWILGRRFTELVNQFAELTGAYIWDSATRECFTREAWKQTRLSAWPETGVPDLTKQFTIHLYQSDEKSRYLRAITLGMEKFALPDIVIEQLIGSDNLQGGNLINVICESLAEQPVLKSGQREIFKLGSLRAEELRSKLESSLKDGATKEIVLALSWGHQQEGDPDNRLIEISFRHGLGNNNDERRQDLLSKFWGASDSVVGVKHTGDILEASKRAKAKLADLHESFLNGLPLGSRLMVKAPFARDDDGNEWMWVEVMKWPVDGKIEGILENDPYFIRKLKAGARVEVKVSDVFDYLLYRSDGTYEGNETGKLMEKQSGPSRGK